MAVRLDASGDYLLRTAALPTSTAFTICGWAVLAANRGDSTTFAALESGTSSAARTHALYASGGNSLRAFSSIAQETAVIATLVVGEPFFFALVGNGAGGTGISGYHRAANSNTLNGASITGDTFTTGALFLGNNSYMEWLNGSVWNAKVWDRALSASELLAESYFARPQFTTGLNLWWPLNSHTDLADRGGNGRSPTVGGTLSTNDTPVSLWRPSRGRVFRSSAAPTGYTLDVASGSYAVTGSSARTLAARKALVTPGSYALTGNPAGTLYHRLVTASPGSYSITGSTGTLLRSYPLSVSPGSYSVTGADGSLIADRLVGVTPGSYGVTGSDVELVYTPVTPSPEIVVTPGSYSVVGADASMVRSLLMSVSPGAYSLAGANAGLAVGRLTAVVPGSYALSGASGAMNVARVVNVGPGAYQVTGSDVELAYEAKNKELIVLPGSYSIYGFAADLTAPTPRRGGGSPNRRGYIIKGQRYWLDDRELAVLIAQMLAEVKRADVQEVKDDKPQVLSRRTWLKLKASLKSLESLVDEPQDDEDDELLLLLM